MRKYFSILSALLLLVFCGSADAAFNVSSAILEFTADGPKQQDIELISHSQDNDYIAAEIEEILQPGSKAENRKKITDPSVGRLLVTPDKTVLTGGSRKVMRFVLLKDLDDTDHIYRVSIKPVVKGVDKSAKVGIKILVGYEVLVIVRPAVPHPDYKAERIGTNFTVTNTGNTNVLFQNGKQCDDCKTPPVARVYAGQSVTLTLPADKPITYQIWDGKDTTEKTF